MAEFVTRFAPSPTGFLHLGHAYSALVAAKAARAANGRFLLRIEDIDRGRCRPAYEAAIFEDLAWLGLEWEIPVLRQSDSMEEYAHALEILVEQGVAYRCFKTRREILDEIARAPHLAADGPEGPIYFGAPLPADEERRMLEAGKPFAWRLSLDAARRRLADRSERLTIVEAAINEGRIASETTVRHADPSIFGDPVIARKDLGTSYHLASVWDDARQGVSNVIRGEDLARAADLHALLQALLGLPRPVYSHHRLITDAEGRRLAKRDKSATIRARREAGASPESIVAALGGV